MINSKTEKDYLVRTIRRLRNGSIKYGYIYSITQKNKMQTVPNPDYKSLFPKTYSAAYYLMTRAKKYIKNGTQLEIVKKSEVTKNE